MAKKIIVFGFPHCGTSILKSIIGHIDNVEEIYDERKYIKKFTFKKYIVCKYPFSSTSFFTDKYKNYIKIFIIRNPLWVFSSLNKRFSYNIPENHDIPVYVETVRQFIYCKENPQKKFYLIKYEDMFTNQFENLKQIFDDIGFNYTNEIFDNSKYTNKIISSIKEIPVSKPKNIDHGNYRTYQINQPIENKNILSKIDLTREQIEHLTNNDSINKLYPNLKDALLVE